MSGTDQGRNVNQPPGALLRKLRTGPTPYARGRTMYNWPQNYFKIHSLSQSQFTHIAWLNSNIWREKSHSILHALKESYANTYLDPPSIHETCKETQ